MQAVSEAALRVQTRHMEGQGKQALDLTEYICSPLVRDSEGKDIFFIFLLLYAI